MRRALGWRRVTLGSGRLTFGLWVHGGRGLSLSFFSVFLMVLSHSNGSSLPSSLFIKQVLGGLFKNSSQVDIVVLHSCPDDDRSMAIETVGIKFSLLKDNVRVGVARSN